MEVRFALAFVGLLLSGCSAKSPTGRWSTGNDDLLTVSDDGSFVSRVGDETLQGRWHKIGDNQLLFTVSDRPLSLSGCLSSSSIKVRFPSWTRTYNKMRSDGTLEPRITASSVTVGDKTTETTDDCQL
jgi:hypothetical protein